MAFQYDEFLPVTRYRQINEIKTFQPYIISREAEKRKKPGYPHTRLVFAAADHNARMINAYDGNAMGLSNRHEYLSRLVRMLYSNAVDGVEAAPDVMEDLMILNYLDRKEKGYGFLEGKMLVGTVNRGGLKDVSWEMDDQCTCFTVQRLNELHMDGLKFMLRINPDCELSKNTLKYCAETVNTASEYHLPVFLEGLFIRNTEKGYEMQTDIESLVKTVGVVSALGCTSLGKWIELPLNPAYNLAAGASTCSFLVVPDEVKSQPLEIIEEYTMQTHTAPNVRGILLGRNVMYGKEDPYVLAEAIANLWHADGLPKEAYQKAKEKVKTINV